MSSNEDRFLRRLSDPRWVPHISSYCDGRCAKCAFTERCWSFAVSHGLEPESPDDALPTGEYEMRTPRAPSWAERHGIDLDNIPDDPDFDKQYQATRKRIDSDILVSRTHSYVLDAAQVLHPLLEREPFESVSHDLYSWALTIGAKTYRAVSSYVFNETEDIERDPVQNDANGSVKVVRLAIEQSLSAWGELATAGAMDPGLIAHLVERLKTIDGDLAERFPLAMRFIRPGFDEEVPGLVRPWGVDVDEDEDE